MKKLVFLTMVLPLVLCSSVFSGSVPDTGQTRCYDGTQRIPCPLEGEPFYGQDAQYVKARSYTKLGQGGAVLSETAGSWLMVKDNVTGLVWEVKGAKDGTKDYNNANDADNTYTWYDPNFAEYPGTPGDGTDTQDFIDKLNASAYGGFSNWRMPTVKELTTLVDRGRTSYPYINTVYFPTTQANWYWTSSSYGGGSSNAWYVLFNGGGMDGRNKFESRYVQAVRSGQ
jgi:hypothetical protein